MASIGVASEVWAFEPLGLRFRLGLWAWGVAALGFGHLGVCSRLSGLGLKLSGLGLKLECTKGLNTNVEAEPTCQQELNLIRAY